MRVLATSVLAAIAVSAGAVPVERLVDPRPGSAVLDITGTLKPEDVERLNGHAANARAGGELLIVVIDSVGGAVPRDYTTRLFNLWGLDDGQRNRGALLLVALRDRKAEIVVGDGFGALVTGITDRIMRDVVIAQFRAGRPRDAIVDGARALADDLILARKDTPTEALPQPMAPAATVAASRGPKSGEGSEARSLNLAQRAALAVIDAPGRLFGALGSALAGGVLLRRFRRYRPRSCRQCEQRMTRLGEAADDPHLTSGEKVEERVGSVDYDVWTCPGCQLTLKLRYGALFTSYAGCGHCGAKTLKTTTTTVTPATESSSGLAKVNEDCAHCSHSRSYTRSIPRVQRSSSSSSSGGSSRGSSSGRGSSGSW